MKYSFTLSSSNPCAFKLLADGIRNLPVGFSELAAEDPRYRSSFFQEA
jgi:hypothetical protein